MFSNGPQRTNDGTATVLITCRPPVVLTEAYLAVPVSNWDSDYPGGVSVIPSVRLYTCMDDLSLLLGGTKGI